MSRALHEVVDATYSVAAQTRQGPARSRRGRPGNVPEPAGAGAPRGQRPGLLDVGDPDLSPGRLDELGHDPVVADPSTVEDDDPVAERGHVLGLVRGEDDRGPLPNGGEHPAQRGPLLRVEAGGRLVEHQQLRCPQQGLGQRGPASLPARQGTHPLAGQVLETHQGQDAPHLGVPGVPVRPLLEGSQVVDEAERREPPWVAALLRQVAQAAPDLGPLRRHPRVAPQDPAAALAGGQHRGERTQQGGLAGTVRPEQPGDPGAEGEVDVLQCRGGAVAPADTAQADGRGHGNLPG